MLPSGWACGVQPQNVLIRWCRRHSGARLPGWVAPAGHGMRWSRSQRCAGRLQPGKLQVMARIRTNAVSAVEGRYWRSAGRSAISVSGLMVAPEVTRSASMAARDDGAVERDAGARVCTPRVRARSHCRAAGSAGSARLGFRRPARCSLPVSAARSRPAQFPGVPAVLGVVCRGVFSSAAGTWSVRAHRW